MFAHFLPFKDWQLAEKNKNANEGLGSYRK